MSSSNRSDHLQLVDQLHTAEGGARIDTHRVLLGTAATPHWPGCHGGCKQGRLACDCRPVDRRCPMPDAWSDTRIEQEVQRWERRHQQPPPPAVSRIFTLPPRGRSALVLALWVALWCALVAASVRLTA